MGVPALASSLPLGQVKEVITDRISGTAIMGYDPVAYFTDNAATLGSARFETEWNGVIWRFSSAANKAAFEGAPEIYAPVNGGYDPVGLDRGRKIAGNPYIFAVDDRKVYLFVSRENRKRFLAGKTHVSKPQNSGEKSSALIVNANGRSVNLTKENVGILMSAIPVQ